MRAVVRSRRITVVIAGSSPRRCSRSRCPRGWASGGRWARCRSGRSVHATASVGDYRPAQGSRGIGGSDLWMRSATGDVGHRPGRDVRARRRSQWPSPRAGSAPARGGVLLVALATAVVTGCTYFRREVSRRRRRASSRAGHDPLRRRARDRLRAADRRAAITRKLACLRKRRIGARRAGARFSGHRAQHPGNAGHQREPTSDMSAATSFASCSCPSKS